MNDIPLLTILLAAGKGVRMRSDLPKVLHPIGGQSMLAHVLTADGSLVRESGTAIIVRANADDHMTQPEGKSGQPIACGVIKKAN